jgi:hypothetical protein
MASRRLAVHGTLRGPSEGPMVTSFSEGISFVDSPVPEFCKSVTKGQRIFSPLFSITYKTLFDLLGLPASRELVVRYDFFCSYVRNQ